MDQVGRYRLIQRLGRGGMASVFEGLALGSGGFQRRVAVKQLLPELASSESVTRAFLDEARVASQLHHPNIVSVLDYGVADALPFQVLELVDGVNLEQLATRCEERGQRLAVPLALQIVTEVARALQYAHSARDEQGKPLSIVHRDVSPANVLISRQGQVKLGDFGIALSRLRLEQTEGAAVKGTLSYMAPEQAARAQVDARADLFALACVLHRLLTGESPLADYTRLGGLALGHELVLSEALPAPLLPILQKGLRARPDQRFSSAAELAQALSTCSLSEAHEQNVAQLSSLVNSLLSGENGKVEPQRGALDALFDLQLVLGDVTSDTRQFTSQQPLPEVAVKPARTPKRGLAVVALAVLATLAALMLAGKSWRAQPPAAQPSSPQPATIGRPSQPSPVQPSIEARPAEPGPPAVARPRRVHGVRVSAEPVGPTRLGTLVIGGPGAQRAQILVDGKTYGFAPKRLQLPVGAHQITLRRADGTQPSAFNVEIADHHTASAPASLKVP